MSAGRPNNSVTLPNELTGFSYFYYAKKNFKNIFTNTVFLIQTFLRGQKIINVNEK